ncbi:MAG: glycosyltransferase [Marinilabiliaceae bacterium]|nr:glycosyltransferase [Marinilabiliaceae bacterium]
MIENENLKKSFQQELRNELTGFLFDQKIRFPADEVLKIDMHCHDHNSDVPDELLGRILNVPETWLKTETLIETLKKNEVDVITITNHNNTRSCFDLKNRGVDVLVGAEYSCMVPDFNVGIHVLAYGMTKEQDRILNKLRHNVYNFQRFALSNNIPTVWAHPLYHYATDGVPSMDFFQKLSLIFERFEVLNGQRDTWQNLLVKFWLDDLTPDKIDAYCDLYDINPRIYCRNVYKKSLIGGSDSHMGIFSGQTGTLLHVPNLKERLFDTPASELALEAIRNGDTAPYGNHQNSEKLTIAFLDYVCQIALFKKDPGLLRILLHKGTTIDKVIALFANNAFSELQHHKVTMRFIEMFHNCFLGKAPSFTQRLFVPKTYKPIFDEASRIAKAKDLPAEQMVNSINNSINIINENLTDILYKRVDAKVNRIKKQGVFNNVTIDDLVDTLEIPSDFRVLFGKESGNDKARKDNRMVMPNMGNFLDGLSFPFLASMLIQAANFTSSRVMYNNRELLKTFSKNIGKLNHPERMLWMTDTFEEKNGVSMFLQEVLNEIRSRNLPIDILVCSDTLKSDDNLIVVKPVAEYKLPFYNEQSLRIPDFMKIHNLFLENEYDRIVCSTEGMMGVAALYLKNAYSVKTWFYMHTDWVMFAKKVLQIDKHNLNRIRRFLRAYYKLFDGVFVLNTDHQKWLTGSDMGLSPDKVHLTAHWVDDIFKPRTSRKEMFGLINDTPVLLYAGRISKEKGVMDIPYIVEQVKLTFPDVKMVFAGTGPAEADLKKLMPDALFLGWVDHKELPSIYSSADLLILPSRFDTFSCVVLESLSCGLPVIAYRTKGPKDIIQHTKNGYLVLNKSEMALRVMDFLADESIRYRMKHSAVERAGNYHPNQILNHFLKSVDLQKVSEYEEIHA